MPFWAWRFGADKVLIQKANQPRAFFAKKHGTHECGPPKGGSLKPDSLGVL